MTAVNEDAFESLHRFADVWHDKYAKSASAGENRKPPSLTMRANGDAAVLMEPQLGAVVAEHARLREELEHLRAEQDDAHRRFDALVHADKAKQGAADWMLNRLHDDRLIDDGTYTSLCGLLRDQIDATRHLTHSEDWGPLTDRFRTAVKRTKDAEAEADQVRERFAELSDGMAVAVELLDRFAADGKCRLDHHGECLTHGLPDVPCPHPLARQVVAAWRAVQAEGASHV